MTERMITKFGTSEWPWSILVCDLCLVQKIAAHSSKLESVRVPVYGYTVIALYGPSLDGATVCCWPGALMFIRFGAIYLLTVDGRGCRYNWPL